MASRIEPGILRHITTEWQDAPRGHKTAVIKKWEAMTNISYSTIYNALPTSRSRQGERLIPGIEDTARTIASIKNAPPEHRGVISTADAKRIALINNQIDHSHADVPHGTIDRVMRDLGLNSQRRRVERYQAEYPNEMHHVDASTSNCLYIFKALPDGDFLLKLHRGNKDYTNKPIPVDGLRPWIYGLTDDHSGVHCCRYVAAKGENSRHNMEFLCWAWWQNPEKCFWGVPQKIKGDHGPMMSSPEAQDFFKRCVVAIDPSMPLNKDAHGKIERPWRTLWQKFELPYFAMSEWKRFEITMSELNSQLMAYSQEYNERRHRYERNISRRQAWERITLHGGVIILPDDALETIAKSDKERTVGQDGVFWMDNVGYEVKGLHDARVKVIVGIFDKSIVVEDLADGQKYEVEAFVPNTLGEFKANKETGQQQMRKAAADLSGITIPIYSTEGREAMKAVKPVAEQPRNVLKMPTRVKETVQLHNPLDLDKHRSIDEAMADFFRQYGSYCLDDPDFRASIRELIIENGMSRRYVAELAGELQIEQQQRMAL